MTAFLMSCGEVKNTEDTDAPRGYINPVLAENLTDTEIELISKSCNLLSSKISKNPSFVKIMNLLTSFVLISLSIKLALSQN